jgi:hypothetical protein
MCWTCDHPGATDRDYHDYMRNLIDNFGWAVQQVESDEIHPPWAYTVGLTEFGQPELVITGIAVDRACRVLNGAAAHLTHGEPPAPGTQMVLIGGPLVEVVRVAQPWAHLYVAVDFYGESIRALQLVHADDHGCWPWDTRYRGLGGGQPILGTREPAERRKRVG